MIAVTACYPIETRGMKPPSGARLIRTPVGERAPEALEAPAQDAAVTLFVSTGFCGGLRPELRAGDLVLADVVHHDDAEIVVSAELLDRARRALERGEHPYRVGPCVCVDRVADLAVKRDLARSGALSVDMESGPLARWAAERGIPFLVLRVVLDPVGEDLPFAIDRSVAASLVRHPVRGFRAARSAARAGRRLGCALNVLLPALEEES